MPHKVITMELADELSATAEIAGATNAIVRREDGSLYADQFDGAGFVRGVLRKGFDPSGKRALVVGNGGVGSAIAAAVAGLGLNGLAFSLLGVGGSGSGGGGLPGRRWVDLYGRGSRRPSW
jgi:shikimate dehydrogenase